MDEPVATFDQAWKKAFVLRIFLKSFSLLLLILSEQCGEVNAFTGCEFHLALLLLFSLMLIPGFLENLATILTVNGMAFEFLPVDNPSFSSVSCLN